MATLLATRKCDLCGGEKPCTSMAFRPAGEDKAAPSPYTGTMALPVPNEFYMYCCEDCGRQQGTVNKTPWILTILGYVLFFGSIALMAGEVIDDPMAAVFPMML